MANKCTYANKIHQINKKLKSGKVGYGTGYRYHDPLYNEINETIELFMNNLDLGGSIYISSESSKRVTLQEKKVPVDITEIFEQLEQLEEDLKNLENFSYDSLFSSMEHVKEARDILEAELSGTQGARASEWGDDFESSNDVSRHLTSDATRIKIENHMQARVKFIVNDLRRNYKEWVHRLPYEDIILGVILFVIYENTVTTDIIDIAGVVRQIWGANFRTHLTNIYRVHGICAMHEL